MSTRFADATITYADLYGGKVPGHGAAPADKDSALASGGDFLYNMDLQKPAIFWAVLVAMLVVVRILVEKA